MSDTIDPFFNPELVAASQEQNEQFIRFNEEIIKLTKQFGYNSFVVTVMKPVPIGERALTLTGIHADTLAKVEGMRRNANQTALAFIKRAVIQDGEIKFQ